MAKEGFRDYVTPFGEAQWAVLDREENIKGVPSGKKSIQLILSGDALEAVKKEVEDFIEETFNKKKIAGVNRPFKTTKEGDKIFIKASTFAFEKGTKKDKRVPLFNAKGEPVKTNVLVGNGSVVRLKTTLQATEFQGKDFIKFWLNGVQIKKLSKYEAGAGSFEAVDDEDGWTGDEFDGEASDEGPENIPTEGGADF